MVELELSRLTVGPYLEERGWTLDAAEVVPHEVVEFPYRSTPPAA